MTVSGALRRSILRNQSGSTKLVNKKALEKASIFGATFIEPDSNEKDRLRIKSGVKIHSLSNGKLKEAGLKPGFIITHVDKKQVQSPSELIELFKKNKGGVLLEGVYIDGTKGYYGFGL